MKAVLKKLQICKTERLQFICPECNNSVLLDLKVFSESPSEIDCYKCSKKYIVLAIDAKKRGSLLLDIAKA